MKERLDSFDESSEDARSELAGREPHTARPREKEKLDPSGSGRSSPSVPAGTITGQKEFLSDVEPSEQTGWDSFVQPESVRLRNGGVTSWRGARALLDAVTGGWSSHRRLTTGCILAAIALAVGLMSYFSLKSGDVHDIPTASKPQPGLQSATGVKPLAPAATIPTTGFTPSLVQGYDAEAMARAESFWKQIWIAYGDTWVARAKTSSYLTQIRNRRVEVRAEALGEADRLNGVEWRGTVAFYRSAERRFGFEASGGRVTMDEYRMGWNEWTSPNGGAVAVYRFKKQNGRWSTLEHDIMAAAAMESWREEMVWPKTSELRIAGINADGAPDTPATVTATPTAPLEISSSTSIAAVTPPVTTAKEPPGFSDPKGPDFEEVNKSPANPDRWPGEQFPETRVRFLSPGELQQWPFDRLQYAINEMFARRGADFGDKRVARWFQQFSWYRPQRDLSFDQVEAAMPQTERDNLKLLGNVRDAKRSTAQSPSAATRQSERHGVNPNFPPDPIGQMIGRFFQSLGDNARNPGARPHSSPAKTKQRRR